MVEALGIIINRRPKRRPRKRENQTIKKIGYVYYYFLGKNRDRLYFLSCIKYGRTKEDCLSLFLKVDLLSISDAK